MLRAVSSSSSYFSWVNILGGNLEPLNGSQNQGLNKIPARKRKPSPEFLTALNLLADSYVKTAQSVGPGERPKSKPTLPKAELNH